MDFIDNFIREHPLKRLKTDSVEGEYIVGGKGKEGFLIFPGSGQDAKSLTVGGRGSKLNLLCQDMILQFKALEQLGVFDSEAADSAFSYS